MYGAEESEDITSPSANISTPVTTPASATLTDIDMVEIPLFTFVPLAGEAIVTEGADTSS